jgi:DNA-binding FrmR family transcriptional regulator
MFVKKPRGPAAENTLSKRWPVSQSQIAVRADQWQLKKINHVLSDVEQVDAISKRIKRAQGQLGAVARMLEEGRNCEEIVTQMSAVSKAVNTAAFTLISASLKECLVDDKSNSEQVSAQLQKLFLSLA